jgi:ribosomal protein S12 methylthiotransferase accessory factor
MFFMEKVFYDGAHRCRLPGQTLAAVTPLLGEFGITRLADVTGLDTLGVPVVIAHRPAALTLTVAQGKGATLDAAYCSAAMEAIETWHGEHAVPPAAVTCPAADLDLPYPVTALAALPGSLVTGRTVLGWIPAVTLAGEPSLVPRDVIRMGRQARSEWRCHLLTGSSSGLASGNTRAEAVAHALFELIERDACAGLAAGAAAAVDLAGVPGACTDLVTRIRAGGGRLQVFAVPSRLAVPCFAAYLGCEDAPWLAGGAGAHPDPQVAFSRAVTEACQSRLTIIAGTRDDVNPRCYQPAAAPEPVPEGRRAGWDEITGGLGWACGTDDGDAARAAAAVAAVTGCDPLIVDLAGRPEFAVVRVLAPGLDDPASHTMPVPGKAA